MSKNELTLHIRVCEILNDFLESSCNAVVSKIDSMLGIGQYA